MVLNKPPRVMNILVFQDHFTKHIMAYVTPNQTTKTIAKFLYQGYIFIFEAPAKLLSNQGANFTSNIIWELCKCMGIDKIKTLPYHAQTNGQVECAHQTIIQMIGKLGEDQKADWPNHLSRESASLQLYKIGCDWVYPTLPNVWVMTKNTSWFLLPNCERSRKVQMFDEYVASLQDHLRAACKEAQDQSKAEG